MCLSETKLHVTRQYCSIRQYIVKRQTLGFFFKLLTRSMATPKSFLWNTTFVQYVNIIFFTKKKQLEREYQCTRILKTIFIKLYEQSKQRGCKIFIPLEKEGMLVYH